MTLLRAMLRAGVMEGGQVRREVTGAPQGGPASPLLCNIYLHRLDRVWDAGRHGVLVRYCDDLVVMCDTRQQAEAALERLRLVLAGLGLELKAAKTRIVHLTEDKDAEGVDFLGFHHRWVRARGTVKPSRVCFLARWPSRKAAQHARDRIRQITDRKRLLLPDEQIVRELNQFLRGWGGYFRYGNSARMFDAISQYALERLAGFVGKRHKRSLRWGMRLVTCGSPDNFGLITLWLRQKHGRISDFLRCRRGRLPACSCYPAGRDGIARSAVIRIRPAKQWWRCQVPGPGLDLSRSGGVGPLITSPAF